MATGDDGFESSPLRPTSLAQNPAPFPESGQDFIAKVRAQTESILAQFMKVLPSNYVSEVTGPFYTLQFQAAAEQLATIQIVAQEVFADSEYDFTRPEFLWEILGTLVFPGATGRQGDSPQIDGVDAYRDFLKRMVILLLRGATKEAMTEGIAFLTSAEVTIIERYLGARVPGSEWTIADQFTFDVFVDGGSTFPSNPIVLTQNVVLVLDALKPAHTLYSYRYLFQEAFGPMFDDTDGMSFELSQYFYDDLRKFCYGAKEITGTAGVTLAGRSAFTDPTRSFKNVQVGGPLVITGGPNAGAYRVSAVVPFLFPNDPVARAYTTSPTGLSGSATVANGVVTDLSQNFALATEGEVLTFATGPNVGSYRLETLIGTGGGPVGYSTGPSTSVRVTPSILRVDGRMPAIATGQAYTVGVDRLGVRTPKTILGEDVSLQFYA